MLGPVSVEMDAVRRDGSRGTGDLVSPGEEVRDPDGKIIGVATLTRAS